MEIPSNSWVGEYHEELLLARLEVGLVDASRIPSVSPFFFHRGEIQRHVAQPAAGQNDRPGLKVSWASRVGCQPERRLLCTKYAAGPAVADTTPDMLRTIPMNMRRPEVEEV
jgi:hypothetical protein